MKDSFIMYISQLEIADCNLNDEQMGKLLRVIISFQKGDDVEIEDPAVKMAFGFIKNQFEIDNKKHDAMVEKQRQNGKKGGAPKGNNNAKNKTTQTTQNNPSDNKTTQTTLNEKENEKENVIKEKNIKKENSLLKNIPQSKKEIAKDFIAYRKEIKKPIKTSLALTKHLSNLDLCVSQNLGTYESLTQKMKEREWLTIEPSYLQGLHVQKNKQKQDMSDYLQSKGIALNNDYIDTEVLNE